jgi:hypothetical protein
MPRRVVVVVNKYWECDPIIGVLLSDHAWALNRDRWPTFHTFPHLRTNPPAGEQPPDPSPRPRMTLTFPHTAVEIWCISDLLEHLPDKSKFQSSSSQKVARLPAIVGAVAPDLVIAAGTAAFPDAAQNHNGSVMVGTKVFLHDGQPGNADSPWVGTFDQVIASDLGVDSFRAITSVAAYVVPRLIPAPNAPSSERSLIAQYEAVAIGNVNVTNYKLYATTDPLAVDAYMARDSAGNRVNPDPPQSLETTHGIIREQLGSQFLFVSGIVDRFGHFDEDVGTIDYAQNFVGAHNAGIAIAWMLPAIDEYFGFRQA